MAGKGSAPRPIDRKGWEESPFWKNKEQKQKEAKSELRPK